VWQPLGRKGVHVREPAAGVASAPHTIDVLAVKAGIVTQFSGDSLDFLGQLHRHNDSSSK
jgi:hypothetical protein